MEVGIGNVPASSSTELYILLESIQISQMPAENESLFKLFEDLNRNKGLFDDSSSDCVPTEYFKHEYEM